MTDIFSPEKRSEVMSKIRSKNTKAELIVFRHLRANGVYFQKHYSRVVGTPDIALPRKKKAVFIDGDFWHGRTLEKMKLNRPDPDDFWILKITKNIRRDSEQERTLRDAGWATLRVWESNIMRKRTRDASLQEIEAFLSAKDT